MLSPLHRVSTRGGGSRRPGPGVTACMPSDPYGEWWPSIKPSGRCEFALFSFHSRNSTSSRSNALFACISAASCCPSSPNTCARPPRVTHARCCPALLASAHLHAR
eukprot:2999225-Rhodomonas_salina.1